MFKYVGSTCESITHKSQAVLSCLKSTPSDSNCIRSYISLCSSVYSFLDNEFTFDMRTWEWGANTLILTDFFPSNLRCLLFDFKLIRFISIQILPNRSQSQSELHRLPFLVDQPGQIGRPKLKARPRRSKNRVVWVREWNGRQADSRLHVCCIV